MSVAFWIKRFVVVLVGAFLIIAAAQVLKGNDVSYAATQGGIWGVITAAVFTATRLYHSRRGRQCAICNDTPEPQRSNPGSDES